MIMRLHRKIYRKILLALLGATKIVSSTDKTIPGKWHNVVDSVKVSSLVLHAKISLLDEEVTREFQEIERDIDKALGNRRLYSKKDLEESRELIEEMDLEELQYFY